ncbi:MAG: PDDEXK nuclease domain-containing protein [Bacteroidota bacterium]|nr:PDDEXK nuclease domain-containing protein [Bacteroidota bacterium]
MKTLKNTSFVNNFESLATTIQQTNSFFLDKVQRQVNTSLTLRNWIIGYYIVEYEQSGKDKADYGLGLFKAIAKRLIKMGVKSLQERNLYLCRDFYRAYPQILQTLSAKSYLVDFKPFAILQTVSAILREPDESANLNLLLTNLSFSHFIELLKADTDVKRRFYEVHAIQNNWSVRDLKRAIESLLYERSGLSIDKEATLKKHNVQNDVKPEDVFRNTYLLEFLEMEEKPSYSESDLEESIITNLQNFLIEMGRGFCFEARQKRITFDNKHYRIDLVFYHRILKTHILLDLKIGEFDHSDSGQMNVYLNYYKDNEFTKGDNDPIGIILCSGKNEALVKYATMGLPQQVFVSKYLINLPSEKELKKIIEEEKEKRL